MEALIAGAQLAHSEGVRGTPFGVKLASTSADGGPMASWNDSSFRLRATPPLLRASQRRSLGLGYLIARPERASALRASHVRKAMRP